MCLTFTIGYLDIYICSTYVPVPLHLDNVNRAGVLNENNNVLPDAAQRLGEENGDKIAKVVWLSNRLNGKAYGSMIMYTIKGEDAITLLKGMFFHVNGEAGYTAVCEPRTGPIQCFTCQKIGHKAFACKQQQRCARCAVEGRHHKECISTAPPKCILYGGPHESYNKGCAKPFPPIHG